MTKGCLLRFWQDKLTEEQIEGKVTWILDILDTL